MADPYKLSDADENDLARGLGQVVDESGATHDVSQTIHARTLTIGSHPWLRKFIPGIEAWETSHHVGNYVIVRATGERIFESMPIYARIGMHLLFYGKRQVRFLHNTTVEEHLKAQSIKEGKIYDAPASTASIPSFIATYAIDTTELLETDIAAYKTFNEFFYRKLKPDARPIENVANPLGLCSAADCRLTVFQTISDAKRLWIKGDNFSLLNLLGSEVLASKFDGGALAVFRLAPADYHRFHSPADVVVGEVNNYPGQYYTVNPQAVNEPHFDVFTANKRSVLMLTHTPTSKPIAFVAIGALLVGSIHFTKNEGDTVKRGEELGYFAYGGSTVVVLFPKDMMQFDTDLVANSEKQIETLVKVGNSLGTAV